MPIHRGPEYHESLRLYLHHPAYRVRGMKVASNTKHPCRRRERRLWAVLVVRLPGPGGDGPAVCRHTPVAVRRLRLRPRLLDTGNGLAVGVRAVQ